MGTEKQEVKRSFAEVLRLTERSAFLSRTKLLHGETPSLKAELADVEQQLFAAHEAWLAALTAFGQSAIR